VLRPLNSICGPNPGCGDALPGHLVTVAVSFPIAFEEWSTNESTADSGLHERGVVMYA